MRILVKLAACTSLAALTACASIVEGSTDTIALSTNPPTQSSCTLANSRGTVNSYAQSSVTVKRSRSDLNIVCSDPRTGAQGSSTVVSDVEAWAFGNILIGGLIGLGVDWGTGAAYTYPSTASVPMSVPPVSYVMPDPSLPVTYDATQPHTGVDQPYGHAPQPQPYIDTTHPYAQPGVPAYRPQLQPVPAPAAAPAP